MRQPTKEETKQGCGEEGEAFEPELGRENADGLVADQGEDAAVGEVDGEVGPGGVGGAVLHDECHGWAADGGGGAHDAGYETGGAEPGGGGLEGAAEGGDEYGDEDGRGDEYLQGGDGE